MANFFKKKLPGNKKEYPLFKGEDDLFKEEIRSVKFYAEYGIGVSTQWVIENTDANIVAVDSSKEWVEHIRKRIEDSPRANIQWIDVGPLKKWGRPVNYSKRENFPQYVNGVWGGENAPELVLIDGRFRVCCFFTSLLRAKPGTRIIFDDYIRRPHYHVVEDVIEPVKKTSRQALFIVPEGIDRAELEKLADRFLYVFE